MEAVTFYETYSKLERVTLAMDIVKYLFLYAFVVNYEEYETKRMIAYLMIIPLMQKVCFHFLLRRKFNGLFSSKMNICMDFFWLVISFRGIFT
jgi:hypothetical protein